MTRLQSIWSLFKYFAQVDPLTSTAPCNPAPGRRLLIIRTDAPTFNSNNLSIVPAETNGVPRISATPNRQGTPHQENLTVGPDGDKKKGGLFRSLTGSRAPEFPVPAPRPMALRRAASQSVTSSPRRSRSRSPEKINSNDPLNASRESLHQSRPLPSDFDIITPRPHTELGRSRSVIASTTAYTQAHFKFSLEFVDRRPHMVPAEMGLSPPRLPLAAQLVLQRQAGFRPDVEARRPRSAAAVSACTYAGRSLAEWTLVVNECQNFFDRRRSEGVPTASHVETPTLGIESFRRPG